MVRGKTPVGNIENYEYRLTNPNPVVHDTTCSAAQEHPIRCGWMRELRACNQIVIPEKNEPSKSDRTVRVARHRIRIHRLTTFSKRRTGLFKKAYELSILCDVDVALIVFSHSENLWHFSGHKSDIFGGQEAVKVWEHPIEPQSHTYESSEFNLWNPTQL